MEKQDWLNWVVELQSLALAGLTYGKDVFDLERYQRIREISAQMMVQLSDLPVEKIRQIFCNETGYQTPKIDTRAAIFQGDKILLVRERDGRWSLPGGWCDVNQSVGDNTVKEVLEEAGLEAEPKKVIAVQDRERHNQPPYGYGICKIFVECTVRGGEFHKNSETTETGYFALNQLPELAEEKNNEEQIRMCFEAHRQENWKTLLE